MGLEVIGWLLVVALFAVGMAGAVYPVLPGVLAVYGAFFVYGLFFGFEAFGLWFWLVQTFIVLVVIVADYAVGTLGVKVFGGSRASAVGGVAGLILGPFVIPVVGLLLGPFLGALIGEWATGSPLKRALKAALGALLGLLSSAAVKIVLQLLMILLFILWLVF